MKALLLLAALATADARPDLWRSCEITSARICGPDECRETTPTVEVYMADYVDSKKKRDSYYYRCRVNRGGCETHYNVKASVDGGSRVWVVSTPAIIATIDAQDEVTDIATRNGLVLIQRGKCKLAPPPVIITPTAPRPRS